MMLCGLAMIESPSLISGKYLSIAKFRGSTAPAGISAFFRRSNILSTSDFFVVAARTEIVSLSPVSEGVLMITASKIVSALVVKYSSKLRSIVLRMSSMLIRGKLSGRRITVSPEGRPIVTGWRIFPVFLTRALKVSPSPSKSFIWP